MTSPANVVDAAVWEWDEWPGDTLVVVPCSAAKLPHQARAAELYTGSLFRLALHAARTLVPDEWIRILSAKHGLVELDAVLAPYDTRFHSEAATAIVGGRGVVSAAELRRQLGAIDYSCLIALCPSAYTARLVEAEPDAICPLTGVRGIGDARHRLALIVGMTVRHD